MEYSSDEQSPFDVAEFGDDPGIVDNTELDQYLPNPLHYAHK